jgi:hypothetical protein
MPTHWAIKGYKNMGRVFKGTRQKQVSPHFDCAVRTANKATLAPSRCATTSTGQKGAILRSPLIDLDRSFALDSAFP